MGRKRRSRGSRMPNGKAFAALHTADMREVSVILERLDLSTIVFSAVRTSTPLKKTAKDCRGPTRHLDFFESESASDEQEPNTKRRKLRELERSLSSRLPEVRVVPLTLTTKRGVARARPNGVSSTDGANGSSSSEDDDSSYRCPTTTETTQSNESGSDWEEFTSDTTSSTSEASIRSWSSKTPSKPKQSMKGKTSSSRRPLGLGLRSTGSEPHHVRAKASGQAYPRRTSPGERLSDSEDEEIKVLPPKKDTGRSNLKAAAKGKQRAHSSGARGIARSSKVGEQQSDNSWEESSSSESTESEVSLTHSRSKRTWLRSPKQKKQTRPFGNIRETRDSRVTKPGKVVAAKKQHTHECRSVGSGTGSERPQKRDAARYGEAKVLAREKSTDGNGTQHVTKKSQTLGLKRKRERNSDSWSSEGQLSTRPESSNSLLSAAKNVRRGGDVGACSGYAARRKSLRDRREGILSSQCSLSSSDDSDDEPTHSQRNSESRSSKPNLTEKRQVVEGSRTRQARESAKAQPSKKESASRNKGRAPLQSRRLASEESEAGSSNILSKSRNQSRGKRSLDFLAARAGSNRAAKDRHVGANGKNAPSPGSSSLLDNDSDDFEGSQKSDDARLGRTTALNRRASLHGQSDGSSVECITLDSESEEPRIPVRRKLPSTGGVPTQVKRNRSTRAGTSTVEREDEISHGANTTSQGSSDNISYSPSNTIKPKSGRPATRKQLKSKTATVKTNKKSGSRSPLVARRLGGSSSQDGSDGSRDCRKNDIVGSTKEGVASKQPGHKGNRAQLVNLIKEKIIERKRHPSSGSNYSAEERVTAESEDSEVTPTDREPMASTQRSLKLGLDATRGTGTRVTRRSSMGAGKDNSLAPRKQQQIAVIQAKNRLRSSLAASGRKAISSSVSSSTVDRGNSDLKRPQKNKVAQSKAIPSEQRGRKGNRPGPRSKTSTRERPASGSGTSDTKELLASELELEELPAGQKTPHSELASPTQRPLQPTQRPPQPKTGATDIRKSMARGSPVRAEGNNDFQDFSSMSEVSSDGSGHLERKAKTPTRLGSSPKRIRSDRRSAAQAKGERATRSSLLGMCLSGLSNSLKHSDNHSEHSWKRIVAQPSTKSSRRKLSVHPGKASSKAVASKGNHHTTEASQSEKGVPRTVTRSHTSSSSLHTSGARPKRSAQTKNLQQAGTEITQGKSRVPRGRPKKASSENILPRRSSSVSDDEDIEQFRNAAPTPIASTNVTKKKNTASQVNLVPAGNNKVEPSKTPKRSWSAALRKVRPPTSEEARKDQISITMPARSGSTAEREQLQCIQNSSATGDHSGSVKATQKQVATNSEEGTKRNMTRNSRSGDKEQALSGGAGRTQTEEGNKHIPRSTKQKEPLHETDVTQAKKRGTSGEHTTVVKVLLCNPPNAVHSSNCLKHFQENASTGGSEGDTLRRNSGAGPSCDLPERAARSQLAINYQQGGTKRKKAGCSNPADRLADLQAEERGEASKTASQTAPSTVLKKQHEAYGRVGMSALEVGKTVAEEAREKQVPLKPKTRQTSVVTKASEQPGPITRPKRKCTARDGGKAPASQKQSRATTKKQGMQTAAKNIAKKLPEMGGASTHSIDQPITDNKTKDSTKRKQTKVISTILKGRKTSEEKAAQPVEVGQVTKSNSATSPKKISKTSHGRGHPVSQQESTAAPPNRREQRALKERIEKPLALAELIIRCSPIAKRRKQHKTAAENQSTAPCVPATTSSTGKRIAATRQKRAAPPKGMGKLLMGAAITAGKGTLKRKRQLRKVSEALAAAVAPSDDIYESSPLPDTSAIPNLLFRESAQESIEDSLMVAGMKTPQMGSVAGSPWKNCASTGVSLCSASSSPLQEAEEIVHAIQKQVRTSRRPNATSTPKVKLKSRKATKNILLDLNKLEGQLQAMQDKENHLGASDVELDYFSEDSSAF
ncbi:unnamed protein product [Ixodes hexagonus]